MLERTTVFQVLEILIVLLLGLGLFTLRPRLEAGAPPPRALPEPSLLSQLAARFDLTQTEEGLYGAVGSLLVRVTPVEPYGGWHSLRIDTGGRIPAALSVRTLPLASRGGTGVVKTHDHFFDDRFAVYGSPVTAGALLDMKARWALQRAGHVEISGGLITTGVHALRAASLERALLELLEVAKRLIAPIPHEERLLAVATSDRNPFVRERALRLLVEHRPASDAADRALWLALDDPHTPAALYAAVKLGARLASAPLRKLARVAASPDELRVAAFVELMEHEPQERMRPLLIEAGRSFYGRFTARAIRWTVEQYGRDGLMALLADPAGTQAENLVAALREASRLIRENEGEEATLDEALEQAVIRILLDTRRRLSDARAHAARLLGFSGSIRALPALKEIARGELEASPSVSRAAQNAISRISARRRGLAGGLAVVEPDAGDLSIADAGTGAISEPER